MPSRIFREGLFDGQVALVTGGGTGIGAAIAHELGMLGATVVIASRKEEHVRPAVDGLTRILGREVFGQTCDIRDRASVDALMKGLLAQHGKLDILVNNGGGQFFAPAETITPNGWDAVIQTNLTGTWNVTRAAADAWMLKKGGSIVNVTMLTSRCFPGMAHSVAARGGVEALTRTLAVEWASRKIRVNSVAPGFVASSGLRRYPAELNVLSMLNSVIPMKRPATCEEIAWAVVYLAGPAGSYVTGQTWVVDGGKSMWGDWWPIPDPPGAGPVVVPKEPWEE